MPTTDSTLATVWLVVLRLMERHGLDRHQLLRDVGVPPETLRDVNARIPSHLAGLVFDRAMHQIADPAFALDAAHCWHPSNLGTLGYAWLSSRTLHTGLKRAERFAKIIGTGFSFHVVEQPDGLYFIHHHGRGDLPVGHVVTDFSLSLVLDMCRRNFGTPFAAQAVQLRRPRPTDPGPWNRFYGCEVQFDATRDGFVIDLATANAPLLTANVPMANTFDAILSGQLDLLMDDDLISRCKALALRELTSGPPTAAWVARELALSPRSLQRRLAALGVSYQELLDRSRYELARIYLGDPGKSLTEITFLLGFSQQSAFIRAFRRWSGMSPTTFRAR